MMENESIRGVFAQRLRQLRKNSGMTQKQVADILRIDRSTYAYYEVGKTTPSYDTLIRLSKIYDISLNVLLGDGTDSVGGYSLRDGGDRALPDDALIGAVAYKGLWRDEQVMLSLYRQMNDDQIRLLRVYMAETLQVVLPDENK